MTIWNAILLGLVQGIAEFLPISSSGHLAIARNLLNMEGAGSIPEFFDVLLHLGTLIAVFAAYWSDIRDMVVELFRGIGDLAHRSTPTPVPPARRLILLIIVGTLPLFAVLPIRKTVQGLGDNMYFVGAALIFTGFLLFLCAAVQAVDNYQDLLRLSVATAGNDHRLGANEAPPAIISIFVGEELEAVIDAIASDSPYAGPVKMKMDLGVDVLPKFSKDTTDRNRTSPFAFTGNKFEFRMPGSAENLSDCNTILNTAVAKELKGYADELEGAEDFTSAAIALIKRTIRDHRRVIFNGNGYTAEWEAEAAKRGLPNKKNTPAALPALVEPKNIQLMEEFGVLTKVEMESRYEVEMEHYSKIINIEALTMLEMARKQLLPAINAYMSEVANTAASKLAVSEHISVRSETKTLEKLSSDADAMSDAIDTLQDAVNAAKALPTESEKAVAFHDNVLPVMDALRAAADDAETICGEDYWPLPSYSKMLYYV